MKVDRSQLAFIVRRLDELQNDVLKLLQQADDEPMVCGTNTLDYTIEELTTRPGGSDELKRRLQAIREVIREAKKP